MEAVGLGKMSTGVSLKDSCEVMKEVVRANHGTLTHMQIHTMHVLSLLGPFTMPEVLWV